MKATLASSRSSRGPDCKRCSRARVTGICTKPARLIRGRALAKARQRFSSDDTSSAPWPGPSFGSLSPSLSGACESRCVGNNLEAYGYGRSKADALDDACSKLLDQMDVNGDTDSDGRFSASHRNARAWFGGRILSSCVFETLHESFEQGLFTCALQTPSRSPSLSPSSLQAKPKPINGWRGRFRAGRQRAFTTNLTISWTMIIFASSCTSLGGRPLARPRMRKPSRSTSMTNG